MGIKQIITKSHAFLGLVSGVIVFIVSITGALYAFKEEVEAVTQTYKKVEAENGAMILPSEALEVAKNAKPGVTVHGVIYREKTDAIEVIYFQAEPLLYGATYINPYSGKVIQTVDFLKTFFGFVRRGHATLWLPPRIGYVVVAIGSIIFFILLVSGIVLWWPRKNSSSKSFSFTKQKGSIKRLEMHKVVGFYVSFFALLIVLTGLSWLLSPLDLAMYKAMGGEKEIKYNPPLSDTTLVATPKLAGEKIDIVYQRIRKQNPKMPLIEVHAVDDHKSAILIELNRDPSTHRKMDYLYFDQYTLEPLENNNYYGSYDDAQIPDKIKRAYYDIHSGGILGVPGKVFAFLISIFCASLPVTGFILWWKRRKEKKAFLQKMNI